MAENQTCIRPGCGRFKMLRRQLCVECFNSERRGRYGSDRPLGPRPIVGSPSRFAPPIPIERRDDPAVREDWAVTAAVHDAMLGAPPETVKQVAAEALRQHHEAQQSSLNRPPEEPRIEIVEETITRVEEHRLKQRVRSLESEIKDLTEQLSDGGAYAEVIDEVLAHQGEQYQPTITPRERVSGLLEATPLVLASDWHIEHEVRPEQVAGRNRYNLEISARRMERHYEATRWAIKHQRDVFKIRDLIFWMGGDFIQNYLHEDDNESNLLSPTDAILFAQTSMTKGLDFLLEDPELEQIVLPCNDGNHGRLTKKMRSSTRIENSLEVFLYAQLAMHYRNEPRIKFILPTSQFTFLDDVYGRTIRFLHGDVFKYGGGVGGITVPMLRAKARWETVKHASLTCMGHWHQRICLPDLMVNGSLIGYDPYAMGGGFPFEPPVQSMRMLDSKRFCSTDIPLWSSERADDDMNARAA